MVLEPRSNWSSVSVSNLTTSRRKSVIAMTRSQGKGAARRPSYYEMPTYSRTGSSASHSYDSQFLSTSSLGVITDQQDLILFLCFSFYQVSGGRTSQGMLDVPGIQDRRASETQVRLDFWFFRFFYAQGPGIRILKERTWTTGTHFDKFSKEMLTLFRSKERISRFKMLVPLILFLTNLRMGNQTKVYFKDGRVCMASLNTYNTWWMAQIIRIIRN